MKRSGGDTIRSAVELVGLVAVVVTLLLVAREIRQANQIAQATITYEIGRDVNQFNELGYTDPRFAELFVKLRDEKFQPTDVEAVQVRLLANRFLNLWTVQEKAHRNGLLSETQFVMTRADVVTVMNAFPALKKPWHTILREQPTLANYAALEPIFDTLPPEPRR